MASTKVTKKLAAEIQGTGSYENSNMFLLPFTDCNLDQVFDDIEDDSIVGTGFNGLPLQGSRHVKGDITQNLEKISCAPILEAGFGAVASDVYSLGANTNKLSIADLDSVKCNEYANVYVTKLSIKGSAGGKWTMVYSVIGVTAQDRDAVGDFPASPTDPDSPFTFQEAGGTNGYVRVGDTTDALDSGDDVEIEDFNLELVTGYEEQFANAVGTLTPVFGQVPPSCSGSFRLARHEDDTFLTFRDDHTPLQLTVYIYKSATATFKIEIPYFVCKLSLTDEDVTKQNVEMLIGRNGIGTSYKNSNMSFTSPVRISVVNS